MDKYYTRQYLPGYTGHIPDKMNQFGISAGEINRRLVTKESSEPEQQRRGMYTSENRKIPKSPMDQLKYGFQSRYATNWIAGPTVEYYDQHIPGKWEITN